MSISPRKNTYQVLVGNVKGTGLSYLTAHSIICWNWVSRLAPLPTLPGFILNLPSAFAHSGYFSNKLPILMRR
jgi:hypothetical protein